MQRSFCRWFVPFSSSLLKRKSGHLITSDKKWSFWSSKIKNGYTLYTVECVLQNAHLKMHILRRWRQAAALFAIYKNCKLLGNDKIVFCNFAKIAKFLPFCQNCKNCKKRWTHKRVYRKIAFFCNFTKIAKLQIFLQFLQLPSCAPFLKLTKVRPWSYFGQFSKMSKLTFWKIFQN